MKTSVLERIVAILVLFLFVLIAYKYLVASTVGERLYSQFEQKTIRKEVEKYKGLNKDLGKESFYRLVNEDGSWSIYSGSGDVSNLKVENRDGKVAIVKDEVFSSYDLEIDGVRTYFSRSKETVTDIPFELSSDNFVISEQEDMFPIFGYHNIFEREEDVKDPFVDMRGRDLESQIKFFNNQINCRWITLADLINGFILQEKKIPRNTCVMTFDDGRKNNFTVAFPLLKKYDVVATFFIIGGRIGQPAYMNAQELKGLYLNGNDLQSHAYTGGSLVHTEWAGKDFNDDDLRHQINDVKVVLDKYGYDVSLFAYPLGDWNQKMVSLMKEAGYSAARGTQKENPWRDKRALSVSMDQDYSWHFNYYEPQLYTDDVIEQDASYTGRWQFEEGLSSNGLIFSTMKPTEKSYGSVLLKGSSEKIKNVFLIGGDGEHLVEVFGHFSLENSFQVKIDGIDYPVEKSSQPCINFDQKDFCKFLVRVNLTSGKHYIEIKNIEENASSYLDYFEIKGIKNQKKQYDIRVIDYMKD